MIKKEMMVFFVPEELRFDRMGTEKSYFIGYDGEKNYSNFSDDLPKTHECLLDFLKNNILALEQNDEGAGRLKALMTQFNKDSKKSILDFKNDEKVIFGMGNIGVSLGKITVYAEN